MFDHFSQTVEELLVAERSQRIDANEDLACGIEGADHVLHAAKIDCGLAPYCSIDHGKQRGRYEGKPAAAHVYRCGKGGEVADHSTTETDDPTITSQPFVETG